MKYQGVIGVKYDGRVGNRMFQYAFMMHMANKFWMKPFSGFPESFIKVKRKLFRPVCDGGTMQHITDNDAAYFMKSPDALIGDIVVCHGYFQNPEFYDRKFSKTLFDLPSIKKNTEDIVLHLRLADYWWKKVDAIIHPSYYMAALKREKYRKAYIVVDEHETNEKYLRYFKGLPQDKIEIVSQSASEDFNFIRSFDRIICSNSSFCWWAAYLSEASKIYTFKPWMGRKHPVCKNLAAMEGAIQIDGSFIHDYRLAQLNWRNYWV